MPRVKQTFRRSLRISCLICLSGLWMIGCARPGSGPKPATVPELTVAAAADLQVAFTEIARQFEPQENCRVLLTFGSTGQLAQQIEHGLPVDIFAAANISYLEALKAKDLIIADTQQLYARGRIVLVVNKQTGLSVRRLEDLVKSNVKYIAIANPGHAPYGVAARQALERQGLWPQVESKIVLGENVRQALQYVETGNAEAGIVALSIAHAPQIEYTLIDESLHEPLDQALAIVAGTKQEPLARAFIAFLNGPTGRPIMTKYGFVLPGETPPEAAPRQDVTGEPSPAR